MSITDYKCIGCGAAIQTDDLKKPGYVDKKVLENLNGSFICKRCFLLKHYNKTMEVEMNDDFYLKTLSEIGKTDSLICNIIDIFDFSGTFMSNIKRLTLQEDIIIVANKRDLLPKSIKDEHLVKFIRHMANKEGVKVLDVVIVSAKSGNGIEELMDKIDKHRKGRKIYFVGTTSVGKSTLLNSIVKKYTDARNDIITTSNIPGTTLDFIEIIYEDTYLVDTPGILNKKQIYNYLPDELRKMITPKKEIKPVVYQLNPKQTIFIGGFAIMDFVCGESSSFVFYFSEGLILHRTKLENKERMRKRIVDEIIQKLDIEHQSFDKRSFAIKNDGKKYDIVIAGLGFFSVKGNVKINMEVIKDVGLYLRESVI